MSSHVFGIFGRNDTRAIQQQHVQAAARAEAAQNAASKKAATPDDSLRQIFAQQTQGAYNPATDDRQVQLLNVRLRLDPQDSAARVELAGIYERYRLYELAMEQYTRALNLGNAEENIAAGLARSARQAGRGAEAIPVVAAFLKQHDGSAEVWNELGLLRDNAGAHAEAEQAFRRAVELLPDSDRMHNNLGSHLLEQNQARAAEAEFRRALEINRANTVARNNLGITLARRGDLEGALREFMAAGDPAAAHNNLAVALIEIGEYEQGRDELVKALQARNYFPPAMENYKLVLALLQQQTDAATAGGAIPLSARRLSALETLLRTQTETREKQQ